MSKLVPRPDPANMYRWAKDVTDYLLDRDGEQGFEVLANPIFLQHLRPGDKPVQDGVMMFDPQLGVPVVATGGAWVPMMMPTGTIIPVAGTVAPTGFLIADGTVENRVSQKRLFDVIGTTYGAGDGSTTFNKPDLRGEFVRGLDLGRGKDPGRAAGSAQGDAMRRLQDTYVAYVNDSIPTGGANLFTATHSNPKSSLAGGTGYFVTSMDFDNNRVTPTAAENRPTNVAFTMCIKT